MNESKFTELWEAERAIYEAWGKYVRDTILRELKDSGKKLDEFLKIPATYRLKDTKSLIDKAFYRADKNYTDPYNEIEDKVGVRFVVLLVSEIEEIRAAIEGSTDWCFEMCKHFEIEREKHPLLFTYQSVHYILSPKESIELNGVMVPVTTPCEVQVRTLLQHAHAELTHDAIYKEKKPIKPKVHRTVAKSMALIETTDGFFGDVYKLLDDGPLKDFNVLERLDGIYERITKLASYNQKSSITIWDTFEQFIDERLIDNIQVLIDDYPFISDKINERYGSSPFFQQSTVLFVYWLVKKRTNRLMKDWPLPKKLLEPIANDLGVSLESH